MRRIGAVTFTSVDVRFIAATNRNLELEVAAGAFRQDLLFRINGVTLELPPLRERREDLDALAERFITRICEREKMGSVPQLSDGVREWMHNYAWPGNIRELGNVIDRAVVMCRGEAEISLRHLPAAKLETKPVEATETQPDRFVDWLTQNALHLSEQTLRERLADIERASIESALAAAQGNKRQAADLLGMPRRTFFLRCKDYGFTGGDDVE